MVERPILMSTEMVLAILDGRKTQTRRIVKGDALTWLNGFTPEFVALKENGLCPYGYAGDILWVRESFAIIGSAVVRGGEGEILYEEHDYAFRGQKQPHIEKLFKWKPSIHMPRVACRLRLRIKGIRIEKLLGITEQDAIAEGVLYYGDESKDYKNYSYEDKFGDDWGLPTARESYYTLWSKINGPGSAEKNPWVWVILFEKL